MLYASCLYITPTQSLIRHSINSQTGQSRQVDCLVPFFGLSVKVRFSRHDNDYALCAHRTTNLTITILRSNNLT